MRTHDPRTRGSAAVELLLSVPFLVLFCLAMNDMARGYRAAQRGQRAARHLAWAEARNPGGGPDAAALLALHYGEGTGAVSRATGVEDVPTVPGLSDVGSLLEDAFDPSVLPLGLDRLGRMMGFITGNVSLTTGTVSQDVSGIRRLTVGDKTMTQQHWVSLFSDPDDDPTDPLGWWDPFHLLSEALSEID